MKSRKLERKNARKDKKIKRNLFYLNKNKNKDNIEDKNENIVQNKSEDKNKVKEKKELRKTNEKINIKRKLSLRQKREIEREEKEIKRLEKKLRLNRRKKNGKKVTTLPLSFKLSGLDYILDVVDSQKLQQNTEQDSDLDQHLDQQNLNFESDSNISEDQEFNELNEDEQQNSDEENDGSNDSQMEFEDMEEDNEDSEEDDNQFKEDIYGFLRDKSGNIVNQPKNELKGKLSIKDTESGLSEQLLRRIRGLMNRLTVNNIMTISSQIKELFDTNSRHSVSDALFKSMAISLIDVNYISPLKMKSESALLISILHHTIGDEVGGHAIHSSICKFNEFISDNNLNESKKMDNLVIFILNLYVCGLIESSLIFEIMEKFCDNFTEKSIELINLILKSIGFILRKDNAIKMKEFILRIQNEAKNVDKSDLSGSRITFLLDSLIAIKNNNITKIKGYGTEIDSQLIESTLKSTIKKSRVNGISGSYDAILQSSHWYSYTQNIETITEKQINEWKLEKSVDNQINDQLFKALRMNTPLRKTIVMALSSCNDYIDAANRLISIGKKQFSEVINVLIHVSIHENAFNPFYSHLFNHLSQCDRKYKLALDFAVRDKIIALEEINGKERRILSKLVLNLLKLNALSITCLKVISFTDMNKIYVKFMKSILMPILEEEQLIEQILSKIGSKDSLSTAIRLFINCFIDPKDRNKLDIKRFTIKRNL